MPGLVKIGMTTQEDIDKRMKKESMEQYQSKNSSITETF